MLKKYKKKLSIYVVEYNIARDGNIGKQVNDMLQ